MRALTPINRPLKNAIHECRPARRLTGVKGGRVKNR